MRITLTIGLPADCPLEGYSGEITSSHRQLDEETCQCQFVVRSEDGAEETYRHSARERTGEEPCICRLVNDHGATAILEQVDGRALTLTAHLAHREEACALYQDVKSHFPGVTVDRLSTGRLEDPATDRVSVNVSDLTGKQRTALELAVGRGYYRNPREVELETLAEELGISRQALSYRLRTAERKLLGQVFTDAAAELDCP